MLPRSLVLVVAALCAGCARAQRTFAQTRFELSPDLPAEEPVLVQEANDAPPDHDPKPKEPESEPAQPAPQHVPTPQTALQQPQPDAQPVQPSQSVQPPVQPVQPIQAPATAQPAFTPFTVAPPPFAQPSAGFGLPPQPPPAFATPFQQPQPGFGAAQPVFIQQQVQPAPLQHLPSPHDVQLVRPQSLREKIELWFREDYPSTVCNRNARQMADAFRVKFPSNLWKNGKEQVLADLLATRLGDCIKKQDADHWMRVNHLINKLSLPITEEEECRSGLIQEQISCTNVLSYTCQFIQKPYVFRLVPARIIIQEARLAEDGAEKCRKIVRKVKKDLQ